VYHYRLNRFYINRVEPNHLVQYDVLIEIWSNRTNPHNSFSYNTMPSVRNFINGTTLRL